MSLIIFLSKRLLSMFEFFKNFAFLKLAKLIKKLTVHIVTTWQHYDGSRQLPEFTQTHVHRVPDAIQPSHPLSSPSPAPNLSQHPSLLQ